MSGVGISFGADRIYDVMAGLGLFPEEVNFSTRVFFTNLGQEEQAAALGLLRELRDAGVAAEIYPDCGKMKKQMEYANRRGIPYVVIVGLAGAGGEGRHGEGHALGRAAAGAVRRADGVF